MKERGERRIRAEGKIEMEGKKIKRGTKKEEKLNENLE
jgi:hypothetical protein